MGAPPWGAPPPRVQVLNFNFLKIEVDGLLSMQNLSSEFFAFLAEGCDSIFLMKSPLPGEKNQIVLEPTNFVLH